MAKRGSISGMTHLEKILGGVVWASYILILPLAADPLFDFLQQVFSISIGGGTRDALYYYILFGLAVIAFWGYLGREGRSFLNHAGNALAAVGIGLAAFYGLNEILFRLLRMLSVLPPNLNDQAILARIVSAPQSTILILVFLAPVIEEVLFRGYIFGNLLEYNRWAAYLASCVLFALMHVWPYFAEGWDPAYLVAMVQYLVPGAVMAWAFERSGSLWGSILLHGAVNALAVWSVA